MIKIETEIYSRISGYYRPVKQFNLGKKSEFSDRQYVKFNLGEPHDKDVNCTELINTI